MSKNITFITGNAGKAEQVGRYLGIPISHKKLDLVEIQSLDISEVVEEKAREAYKLMKTPVVVDDNSLVINALGRLPGPFIKYFIDELGNSGMCELVKNYEDKSAIVEVAIGYCDDKGCKVFNGKVKGSIASAPAGKGGFGWDNIFIPEGFTETRAQMNADDYDKTSPRRLALEKLERYFEKK
jgi:non-canonical purine NTP pyrophosphatase (RdgB/HAM1 family)